MPSHRSTNFGRLKELLSPLPQRTEEDRTSDALLEEVTQLEPAHAPSTLKTTRSTADVQQMDAHQIPRSYLAAKPGKNKPITRPSTFRLAVELQDALKVVAEYNRLNMTDIVAEGIWLHIQSFEWPPESEDLKEQLRLLF